MSTNPKNPTRSDHGAASRRSPVKLTVGVVGVLVVAVLLWVLLSSEKTAGAAVATVPVSEGPLVISVTEAGTVQNLERVTVKSEVEGSNTILYLVPEGTHVKKGELLVEIDSSKLVDDRTQQQIVEMNAEAAFIGARENLEVVKSQSQSDVDQAELNFDFAKQDLKKYQEGDYPQALKKAQSDIDIAKETLSQAKDKLEWSKKFAEEKYITETELQADVLAEHRAQIDVDLAVSALNVLQKYTHDRDSRQLQSNVKQAQDALDRTKRKASANVVQAQADLKAKESEYDRQKSKLDKLDQQITKCRITAPVAGMVVYASTGDAHRFRTTQPLDEGQQVRERQELIYLPTNDRMKADIKIHEASLRKVRVGMPVRVTVDALPGKVFWGKVSKIALLPDAQSAWLNPDLKVYDTQIDITQGETGTMRAGMSCQAEIVVEQFDDALSVPVQSVVRVGGKSVVYVPGRDGPKMQDVEVGLDNNRVIRIIKGLRKGEQVLLAPPLAPSAVSERATGKPVDIPTNLKSGAPAAPKPSPGTEKAPANAGGRRGAGPGAANGGNGMPSRPDLRNMTPEQKKQWFDSLTPEQKAKVLKRFQQRGGRRRPGGAGGAGSRAGGPGGEAGGR